MEVFLCFLVESSTHLQLIHFSFNHHGIKPRNTLWLVIACVFKEKEHIWENDECKEADHAVNSRGNPKPLGPFLLLPLIIFSYLRGKLQHEILSKVVPKGINVDVLDSPFCILKHCVYELFIGVHGIEIPPEVFETFLEETKEVVHEVCEMLCRFFHDGGLVARFCHTHCIGQLYGKMREIED